MAVQGGNAGRALLGSSSTYQSLLADPALAVSIGPSSYQSWTNNGQSVYVASTGTSSEQRPAGAALVRSP